LNLTANRREFTQKPTLALVDQTNSAAWPNDYFRTTSRSTNPKHTGSPVRPLPVCHPEIVEGTRLSRDRVAGNLFYRELHPGHNR
jgi:hypothetical protein